MGQMSTVLEKNPSPLRRTYLQLIKMRVHIVGHRHNILWAVDPTAIQFVDYALITEFVDYGLYLLNRNL